MSFDFEVYRRLPLADATLQMLRFVADAEFLAALFDQHRGRSYERQISFADLVHLLAGGLVVHGQSAHRTFQQAHEAGDLSATARAAYDKVARLPVGLSAALLTQVTARLRGLLPAPGVEAVPDSVAAFTPLAFDGKKVKQVARRLRAARSVRGHVVGGKILVAEDIRTGLAAALAADPDGEASDLTLLPGLLTRARAVVAGPRLWVGDRLFCDLVHLPMLTAEADHFVVRYCGKVKFHPDPKTPAKTGHNSRGQAYTEQWGWLGGPTDERRQYVRRITAQRPEDEDVVVVTSLTDAEAYPAPDLLDLYLRRWGIERLFQKVTEVFHLQALISAQANGTVFQAALCLLLYNLTIVIRAHVAAGATKATADVSLEKLFEDVRRQLTGLNEVLGIPAVVAHYAAVRWNPEALREYLRDLLGPTWRAWWTKSPPRKKSKPTPTEYLKGGHSSVYRIVRGLHETIPEKPPPTKGSERHSKQ